ncbi:MAG: VOC family protein [Candidatus Rokubacteria bacterium]|nr:VOC family protein [Candidatus Rokubacteria bacterium]
MKARELGHVVLYVRDIERALRFYRDLLGFREVGRVFDGRAAALTAGRTHHEILLIEVGPDAAPMPPHPRVGLYHVGVKVGDSLDELRAAYRELVEAGVRIVGASDHTVSQSLYVLDPDGHEVEVYVDADPSIWRDDPGAVLAPIKPLQL